MKKIIHITTIAIALLFTVQANAQCPIADQTVTGNTTICAASVGEVVNMASSVIGVNYTLRNDLNDTVVDGPIAGTGSPIVFNTGAVATTTTYNVYGEVFPVGGALEFSDNGIYLETPLTTPLTNVTVEAWVNPTSFPNAENMVISKGAFNFGPPTFKSFQFFIRNNGTLEFGIYVGATYFSVNGGSVALNQWQHIVGVYDGSFVSIYINGVLVGSLPAVGTINADQNNLDFGSNNSGGSHFVGKIDDVRIWDDVRSPSEIANNMSACLLGTESNLIALYNFEEGSGTSTADLTGITGPMSLNPANILWVSGVPNCTASCTLELSTLITVTITDVIAPVADSTNLADVTDCSSATPTAPTATDNCAGTVTGTTTTVFPITTAGTTVVTWTYDDGNGNTTTQTQNVIINLVLPTFTAPADTVIYTNAACTYDASVAVTGDVTDATDNCNSFDLQACIDDVPTQAECMIANPTLPPFVCLSLFNNGVAACDAQAIVATYVDVVSMNNPCPGSAVITRTWSLVDGSGNAAADQVQIITVTDSIAPIVDAPTLANVTAACSVAMPTAPTATDNCGGAITGTTTTVFPITAAGTTVVIWSYTDCSGNTATQTQNVIITGGTTTSTDVQTACDTYTWAQNGMTYTTTGMYNDTIPNTVGCDSIITLDLTVFNNGDTDVITACDTHTWIDGITYVANNNTATHTLSGGCLVTLDLIINNSTTVIDTITACNTYTWIDGNTYTSSNTTATHTLTNAAGCDSVITLNLTIFNNGDTDVVTACDAHTWIDGVTYTANNNSATHTLSGGCLVTLDLTINNSSTSTDIQTACDTYTWIDGNTYTASNSIATHTLTNAAGCDSVITLALTINNSYTGTDTQVACDTYTWIDGNTYTVSNTTATHTLTNAAGCDSIITLALTINNSNTGTDTQVACNTYTWIDGNTYTANNTTATFNIVGGAVGGCDSLVTLNLTINPNPIIDAGLDQSIIEGETVTINATSDNSYIYSWSPITGLSNPLLLSPDATPLASITYILLATSVDGCMAEDSIFIEVSSGNNTLVINNILSPNGDGKNDTWIIDNLGSTTCSVSIYNRWGTLIFQSPNYQNDWDGTFNGNPLPEGTYYYTLQLEGDATEITGAVTILSLNK